MQIQTREGLINGEIKARRLTIWMLIFFLIVVGIPVWWKTTEIYRAPLPYEDIYALGTHRIHLPIQIDVAVLPDVHRHGVNAEKAAKVLTDDLETKQSVHGYPCHVTVDYSVRAVDGSDDNPTTLDAGHYRIVFTSVEQDASISPAVEGREIQVTVAKGDVDGSIRAVGAFIDTMLVDRPALRKQAKKTSVDKRQIAKGEQKVTKREHVIEGNDNYDIELSLIVADPGTNGAEWDVLQGVGDHLTPFLSQLDHLVNFTVASQVLYYSRMGVKPRKRPVTDTDKERYADVQLHNFSHLYELKSKDLTKFIDTVEWPLATVKPDFLSTPLNLLAYVPSLDESPLYVMEGTTGRSQRNAFTIPQWGGVYVINTNRHANQASDTVNNEPVAVDMGEVMSVFIAQLRYLLGMATHDAMDVVQGTDVRVTRQPSPTGASTLDIDRIARIRLVEHIAKSTSTLSDLAKLLEEVEKMNIRDELAVQVRVAVSSLEDARTRLATGDFMGAYECARTAMANAERAFFDPTVVKLLYFPDENKYAIYVPLFVPLFFNILGQVRREGKGLFTVFR